MSLAVRSLRPRSLTLQHLFHSLLQPIPSPAFALSALAFPSLPSTAGTATLDRLRSLLEGWVFAVPKSKTSHSKKSMRSSNKGLKEDQGEYSPSPQHSFSRNQLRLARFRAVPTSSIEHFTQRDSSTAIVSCPSCGTPKRAHHLCHGCHTAYRQEFHQEAKHLALQKKLDKLSEESAGKSLA